MKTIYLQNDTGFRDNLFKVIVNGETHIMRHKSLTIQVPEDKHFEIKTNYFGDGSPLYTLKPKDNIVLQISKNRRFLKTYLILFFTGLILSLAIAYFYENGRFMAFIPMICLLFPMIYQIFNIKKFFVIQEVTHSK